MVQGAEARAAMGFGKRISTEQDFPGSPAHQAGLEASDWHLPMYPGGPQTQAHMRGCAEPGRGQGCLRDIFKALCIPHESCMLELPAGMLGQINRHLKGSICPNCWGSSHPAKVFARGRPSQRPVLVGWHPLTGTQGGPCCQCLSRTA